MLRLLVEGLPAAPLQEKLLQTHVDIYPLFLLVFQVLSVRQAFPHGVPLCGSVHTACLSFKANTALRRLARVSDHMTPA